MKTFRIFVKTFHYGKNVHQGKVFGKSKAVYR